MTTKGIRVALEDRRCRSGSAQGRPRHPSAAVVVGLMAVSCTALRSSPVVRQTRTSPSEVSGPISRPTTPPRRRATSTTTIPSTTTPTVRVGRVIEPRPTSHVTSTTSTLETTSTTVPGRSHYHGGPVMHDPRVYLIVWGPHYPTVTLQSVRATIAGLAGTGYAGMLTQYYDTHGHIHDDIRLAGSWADPIPAPTDLPNRVEPEIFRARTTNSWPADANALFVLLLPPGVNDGACGWHGWNPPFSGGPLVFAVVTYADAPGCARFPGQLGDGLTFATYVVVHELAEAITDPYDTGWYDFPSPGVNTVIGEIADDGTAAWVPQLFSETAHSCRDSVSHADVDHADA